MTEFDVLHKHFLAQTDYKSSGSADEILFELNHWVIAAIGRFKFPRIDLTFSKVENENTSHYSFNEELTNAEIGVLVEFMKLVYLNAMVLDNNKYENMYNDANLKTSSQGSISSQLNRAYENQLAYANKIENEYYRTKNNKPLIGTVWM